jgi:competence protein CoiA
LAKTIIAKAALAEGWDVQTEARGVTPAGEAWIADVLASKGKAKVAFEVQWSTQDDAETRRRQRQYADSQIRGLWFFKQTRFESDKELPAFNLAFDGESLFSVGLPARYGDYAFRHRSRNAVDWQQIEEIGQFVCRALRGELRWAPAVGGTFPVKCSCVDVDCWKCKRRTALVISLEVDIASRFPDHPNFSFGIYDLEGHEDLLRKVIPDPQRIAAGVGPLKKRYSKTRKESYLSNGCRHCDAIQGQFFGHEYSNDASPRFVSEITLDQDLFEIFRKRMMAIADEEAEIEIERIVQRWCLVKRDGNI